MSQDAIDSTLSQADHWLARRRLPGLRSDERDEFERWLASDPTNRRAYNASESLWGELAELQKDDEIAALASAAALPEKRPSWRPMLALAGIAAAAILSFAPLKNFFYPVPQFVTYATAVGEQRSVTLGDGSVVTLNTDTEVAAGFTRKQRELVLKRGEALFKVQHDAERPFVVAAEAGTVTALGTQFQVRRDADTVTVTLLEGSVAVRQNEFAEEQTVLKPGEQAEYRASVAGMAKRHADIEAAISWTKGQLIFRDTPLAEAVAEVNRFSTSKLIVAPEIMDITVSGTFGTTEPESFASALEAMFPIQALPRTDKKVVQLVRRNAE